MPECCILSNSLYRNQTRRSASGFVENYQSRHAQFLKVLIFRKCKRFSQIGLSKSVLSTHKKTLIMYHTEMKKHNL